MQTGFNGNKYLFVVPKKSTRCATNKKTLHLPKSIFAKNHQSLLRHDGFKLAVSYSITKSFAKNECKQFVPKIMNLYQCKDYLN